MCALDGSSNEHDLSGLSYDSSTGKFNGDMITNLCSAYAYGAGTDSPMYHTSSCRSQTFPAPDYADDGPFAAPLRDRIALTVDGVNIYGPFDAGFTVGMVCDEGGYCDGGSDVPLCEESLEYLCEKADSTINYEMLLDSCNGHAIPYHYHADMSCMYADEDSSTHSPIIGIALDGYGIYGLYEGDGAVPTLDACGGHTATVPANSTYGITSSSVYHYHTMDYAPYTLGCFGPVDSVSACMDLYPDTCFEDPVTIETSSGNVTEVLDCPCFDAPSTLGERDHFTVNNPHFNNASSIRNTSKIHLIDGANARRLMDENRRIRV